jgi:hypothetical protein
MATEAGPTDELKARGQRATVEWLPPELERVRVTRVVQRPFGEVERSLRVRPDHVVQLAYGDLADEHDGMISLALHPSAPWLRVRVRVQSFTPIDPLRGVVISIRWTPTRLNRLLPTMEADLKVRSAERGSSELELEGHYRPPLGVVGLVIDRVVGRFVASATAKTFLDLIGDCLEKS